MPTARYKTGLPALRSLRLYRGDTWTARLRWGSRASESGPTTYHDLSACSAKFAIRDRQGSLLVEIASPEHITLNASPSGDPEDGWILITMPATLSAALPPRPAVADVEITFPDGRVVTLIRWVGNIEEDVAQ